MAGFAPRLFAVLGLLSAAACGGHRPTVYLPAQTLPRVAHGPLQPPPPSGLKAAVAGPGPRRVAADAQEVVALRLSLQGLGPDPVELSGVVVQAAGRLDDANAIATARLAEDVDGDGAFDRSVDRVLATGGFANDDGEAVLQPAPLSLAPGAALELLVLLDLSGSAAAGDDVRLLLDAPADLWAAAPGGVDVALQPAAGPTLRVGAWTLPEVAFETAGDSLRPRAVRDGRGRTHVVLYRNHNMSSDVLYTLHDGRCYSPPDDVSRTRDTAWNQDLAVDAGDAPHVVWEQWDATISDFAARYSAFDPARFAWTPAEVVSTTAARAPKVTVLPAGPAVAVWEDHGLAAQRRVGLRARGAGGWGAVAEVTSASATVSAQDPVLAARGGEALIAWCENGPVASEVRLRTWSAAAGFGPVEVVARSQQLVEQTALVVVGGQPALAFVAGDEVFYAARSAAGWSQPVNVSRSPGAGSTQPALVVHRGEVHAVWVESDPIPGATALQIAHAVEQGGAFGPVERLTSGGGARSHPAPISEGERLRVVWQDWSLGRQRVLHAWSAPDGLEAPLQVAAPGGAPHQVAGARTPLGADFVAWAVDAGGASEVFVAARDPGAAGFGRAENVSRSAAPCYQPALAADGEALWAAWEQDAAGGFQIVAARRDALGVWGSPAPVSSATPAYAPRLATAGPGRVALAYTAPDANGRHRITLREHTQGSWSAARQVPAPAAADAWSPWLTADGVRLAAAYELEEAGRRAAWVALPTATGFDVAPVGTSAAAQYSPRVAFAGADLHAAWLEDGRVRVAARPAGGSFAPPVDLNAGGAGALALAAFGPRVAVAWEQWTGGDARVVLAIRDPAGAWSAPAPLDLEAGPARGPAWVAAAGGLQALWTQPGRVLHRQLRED